MNNSDNSSEKSGSSDNSPQAMLDFLAQVADGRVASHYLQLLAERVTHLESQLEHSDAGQLRLENKRIRQEYMQRELPPFVQLVQLLPACFMGFWSSVSIEDLESHTQQARPTDFTLYLHTPNPQQLDDAKTFLATLPSHHKRAFGDFCQHLQQVYRLSWQREFKSIVLGANV